MNIEILSPLVEENLAKKSTVELSRIIFLEKHPEYPTHYLVESFNPTYIHDFGDLIGEYRAIFQFEVDKLRERADDLGYAELVYIDDPSETIERQHHLDDPYPFPLSVNQFRFQLRGFNYCKDLRSDIINWSTGTGKSIYAVAKAKYLLLTNRVDRVVIVSKGHNKINWQRTFKDIGDLDAMVAESPGSSAEIRRARRNEIYETSQLFIINYEKLRFKNNGDGSEIAKALKGERVYFIWDEMPTRLKNRSTEAWKGAQRILRVCKEVRQSMLSATPLENSPEDIYSCVKLLDPSVFGTLSEFRARYAKSFNPFMKWQVQLWDHEKLQEMGMRLAHMTHQANKYRDPEIRAEFPAEHWEDIIIDMSDEDKILYLQVEKKLAEEFQLDPTENILPKLLILQLICNNPALLYKSNSDIAKRITESRVITDKNAAKLAALKEMLEQIEGKIVLFSMYNDFGSKSLADYIQSWGHSYVLYDGSDKKKQEAQDRFQYDPLIKLFVSSDQGSDSINLEQATTVINYDMPWKYSTLLQRVNRINRITSSASHVWYFNLIVAGTMEERKLQILNQKRLMQEAIDDPSSKASAAVQDLTAIDYRFILLGY
jgi:SNF2 family DNA or RNA helicase